jgi:hypothetical protein
VTLRNGNRNPGTEPYHAAFATKEKRLSRTKEV